MRCVLTHLGGSVRVHLHLHALTVACKQQKVIYVAARIIAYFVVVCLSFFQSLSVSTWLSNSYLYVCVSAFLFIFLTIHVGVGCLSVPLNILLPAHLFTCLILRLNGFITICLTVKSSICPPLYSSLSDCMSSICLLVCLICLSVPLCQTVYFSICPPVCYSLSLTVYSVRKLRAVHFLRPPAGA